MNQLIHCITCDALFLKTPFDQEPEYEYTCFCLVSRRLNPLRETISRTS